MLLARSGAAIPEPPPPCFATGTCAHLVTLTCLSHSFSRARLRFPEARGVGRALSAALSRRCLLHFPRDERGRAVIEVEVASPRPRAQVGDEGQKKSKGREQEEERLIDANSPQKQHAEAGRCHVRDVPRLLPPSWDRATPIILDGRCCASRRDLSGRRPRRRPAGPGFGPRPVRSLFLWQRRFPAASESATLTTTTHSLLGPSLHPFPPPTPPPPLPPLHHRPPDRWGGYVFLPPERRPPPQPASRCRRRPTTAPMHACMLLPSGCRESLITISPRLLHKPPFLSLIVNIISPPSF